jgi:hypothetical protein
MSEMKAFRQELLKAALSSEDGEAFQILETTSEYRVGLGVRVASRVTHSFFIEIVLLLGKRGEEVNLDRLRRACNLLTTLREEGYGLLFQGDATVLCEHQFGSEKEVDCCEGVVALLEDYTRTDAASHGESSSP